MAFLLLLIVIRLLFSYQEYQGFITKPFYYTYAHVTLAYEKTKKNKRYQVLKLKSDEGLHFYTTTHLKKDFNQYRLRVQIFPNDSIGFTDYLGTFYIKSKIKKQVRLDSTGKDRLLAKVASAHSDPHLQSFYKAIFFCYFYRP
ncbi:MAG: hypothetical protein Q9M36_09480 [Sulfurovum sp.]|nr:hypothetical protein [Sulfurovum sp.]